MDYNYNPAVRHTAYNGSGYQYDVSPAMTANMYPGFSGVGDVFVTSGAGQEPAGKRRFEDEQYMRACKRPDKDSFYFAEPSFTDIG